MRRRLQLAWQSLVDPDWFQREINSIYNKGKKEGFANGLVEGTHKKILESDQVGFVNRITALVQGRMRGAVGGSIGLFGDKHADLSEPEKEIVMKKEGSR